MKLCLSISAAGATRLSISRLNRSFSAAKVIASPSLRRLGYSGLTMPLSPWSVSLVMTKLLMFRPKPPDLKLAAEITQPPKPPDPPDPPDPLRLLVSGNVIWSRIMPRFSSTESLHLTSYSFMEVLQQVSLSFDICCRYFLLMITSLNNHLLGISVMSMIQVVGKLDNWIYTPLSQFPLIIGINPPFPWSVMEMIQSRYSIRYVLILPRLEGCTSVCLVSRFEISLAFVRTFTAVCRFCSLVLSSIEKLSISLWQVKRDEIVKTMFPVNLDYLGPYCLNFPTMEYGFSPMFPFLLSGFVAGTFESKIVNASALILFEGSVRQCISALVAQIMIDYSALVAVSISDIGLPCVFIVSGIVSPLCNIDVDLLHGFSCLSAWTTSIFSFYALWFAFVVLYLMVLMAFDSCFVNNNFSLLEE